MSREVLTNPGENGHLCSGTIDYRVALGRLGNVITATPSGENKENSMSVRAETEIPSEIIDLFRSVYASLSTQALWEQRRSLQNRIHEGRTDKHTMVLMTIATDEWNSRN